MCGKHRSRFLEPLIQQCLITFNVQPFQRVLCCPEIMRFLRGLQNAVLKSVREGTGDVNPSTYPPELCQPQSCEEASYWFGVEEGCPCYVTMFSALLPDRLRREHPKLLCSGQISREQRRMKQGLNLARLTECLQWSLVRLLSSWRTP